MGKTEDKHNMLFQVNDPPCFYCIHLLHIGEQFDSEGWSCKAFPNGIPHAIWFRSHSHNVLYPIPERPTQKGPYVFESKVVEWPDGKFKATFDGEWVPVQ